MPKRKVTSAPLVPVPARAYTGIILYIFLPLPHPPPAFFESRRAKKRRCEIHTRVLKR